jgi:protein-tyrosine-phosphatase/predicted ATP-grasp superfamily ATP-dependent carboligase
MARMAARQDVLVLDGDKIAALDVVRAYGRRGLSVAVGASRADAIGFRSRFADRREVYPDPRHAPGEFIQWLAASLRRDRVDLVVPITDLTTLPIAAHRGELDGDTRLATESFETLQIVCDKLRTIDLARKVGVPAPATTVVRTRSEVMALRTTYPIVCKPLRSSVWSEDSFRAMTVWYARNETEFRAEASRTVSICPLLVQPFTRGYGVGIELLARDGELLQVFQHRRLHELPLSGGGSTYRTSEAVDPRLRDSAARLMAALRWTGVAMVEFKIDASTGDALLMEINGRFWGSLALSSRAGLSFANDLYDLHVLQRRPQPRSYAVGVRCRKLGDDLEWFKERLTIKPSDPLIEAGVVLPVPRAAVLRDLLTVADPRVFLDVQVWWDPVPGLRDLAGIVRTQAAGVLRKVRGIGRKIRNRVAGAFGRPRLLRAAARADRILFLCHGNIMRSAFAAEYCARRARESGRGILPASAGVYHRSGRAADPRAIAAAREWHVDLSAHRSKTIDDGLVKWADLILVMDRSNLNTLHARYPEARGKSYLLGLLDATPDTDIPDPYAAGLQAMQAACGRIAGAIDRLVQQHAGARGAA